MYSNLSILATVKVSLTDALVLSLVGIVLIMIVLIVLMYVIKLMSKVLVKNNDESQAEPVVEETNVAPQTLDSVTAKGTCGNVTLVNVNERDAAMIMAIVSDQTQIPLNELKFVSIKLVD